MNTTTFTVGMADTTRARLARTDRIDGRGFRQRFAATLGLALLAWTRRADAQRTHDAVAARLRNERIALHEREHVFTQIGLLTGAGR